MRVLPALFECLNCHHHFTEKDCLDGNFFVKESVCYACYSFLKKLPLRHSCFGKIGNDTYLGYDKNALECKSICPDRKVCPMFVSGDIEEYRKGMQDQTNELTKIELKKSKSLQSDSKSFPFRQTSLTHEAFTKLMDGLGVSEFNKWCSNKKIKKGRLLRLFRKEERYGKKWKWIEQSGVLRIVYPL